MQLSGLKSVGRDWEEQATQKTPAIGKSLVTRLVGWLVGWGRFCLKPWKV